MNIRLNFTNTTDKIPVDNQKELNSFVHRVLGHDNKFHDAFSNYSISGLQGGILDKGTRMLSFRENPYIMISSMDNDFLIALFNGLSNNSNEKFFGCAIKNYEVREFNIHEKYDIVRTISPILLKDKTGRKITIRDNNWLATLTKQCRNKLKYAGVVDDTFSIEIMNMDNMKTRLVYVGNVFNPCTSAKLIIKGKPETRRILYNLGLGNSCGSGFGAIKIY